MRIDIPKTELRDKNGVKFQEEQKVTVRYKDLHFYGRLIHICYEDHTGKPLMVEIETNKFNDVEYVWCPTDTVYVQSENLGIADFEDLQLGIKVSSKYEIEIVLNWYQQRAPLSDRMYVTDVYCSEFQALYWEEKRIENLIGGYDSVFTMHGIVPLTKSWRPKDVRYVSNLEIIQLDSVKPNTIKIYQNHKALITKVTRNGKAYIKWVDNAGKAHYPIVYQSELKPWKISDKHSL